MAKDSFIIYKSFYAPIKTLSDKQLGRLFRALFDYQIEGSTEVDTDIHMAFAFFKNQMDIDESKYQKVVQRNRENGSKGGRKPKEENPKNPVGYKKPKKADNDNVNANVNDNANIPPNPPKGKGVKKSLLSEIPKEWIDVVSEWLDYKKSKRQTYRSAKSVNFFYDELVKLSGGDLATARQIIKKSMGNNWAGIFELKNKTNENKTNQIGSGRFGTTDRTSEAMQEIYTSLAEESEFSTK